MSEPNTEAYSASKGGLVSLTHALAASLSKMNSILAVVWVRQQILHRLANIYRPVGFITGTNLVVDGGMTVKMIYE